MIVCADGDDGTLTETRERLADGGFATVGCGSSAEAADFLQGNDDVEGLVTAYDLPDGDGLELIQQTRETYPDAVCVLFTDVPLEDIDTEAFGDVIAEYLRRDHPDAHDELVDLVEHGLAFQTQTAYPLPSDEDARIAALEQYAADAAALGESIDRLSELATAMFDTRSAAVGLVDAHEERFLSCYGASFEALDREETICTYTILNQEEVTVVEEVSADPRFSENDGLAAADIEFYAGAPIVTPDGHAIGVFCLHDAEPRSFSARERELLMLFAEEVMEQLELRRRLGAAETARGEVDG